MCLVPKIMEHKIVERDYIDFDPKNNISTATMC